MSQNNLSKSTKTSWTRFSEKSYQNKFEYKKIEIEVLNKFRMHLRNGELYIVKYGKTYSHTNIFFFNVKGNLYFLAEYLDLFYQICVDKYDEDFYHLLNRFNPYVSCGKINLRDLWICFLENEISDPYFMQFLHKKD